jgi:hypothetical protein
MGMGMGMAHVSLCVGAQRQGFCAYLLQLGEEVRPLPGFLGNSTERSNFQGAPGTSNLQNSLYIFAIFIK